MQKRSVETRLPKVTSNKAGAPQISPGEIGRHEGDAPELRPTQVRLRKIDPVQFGVTPDKAEQVLLFARGEDSMNLTLRARAAHSSLSASGNLGGVFLLKHLQVIGCSFA